MVCYRVVCKTEGVEFKREEGEARLPASLVPETNHSVGSQGMPNGVGGWDSGESGEGGLQRRTCVIFWRQEERWSGGGRLPVS